MLSASQFCCSPFDGGRQHQQEETGRKIGGNLQEVSSSY